MRHAITKFRERRHKRRAEKQRNHEHDIGADRLDFAPVRSVDTSHEAQTAQTTRQVREKAEPLQLTIAIPLFALFFIPLIGKLLLDSIWISYPRQIAQLITATSPYSSRLISPVLLSPFGGVSARVDLLSAARIMQDNFVASFYLLMLFLQAVIVIGALTWNFRAMRARRLQKKGDTLKDMLARWDSWAVFFIAGVLPIIDLIFGGVLMNFLELVSPSGLAGRTGLGIFHLIGMFWMINVVFFYTLISEVVIRLARALS